MENSNAQSLIKKIQNEVIANGIQADYLIPELKKLREFALLEQKPVIVKALRLAYEHIEANNDFLIPIPSDEPIDEVENETESTNTESFNFMLSLLLDTDNKLNIEDLRNYNKMLQEF